MLGDHLPALLPQSGRWTSGQKSMPFPNSLVPKGKVSKKQTPISSMLRLLCLLGIARGNKGNILASRPLCSHIIQPCFGER